MYMQCKDRATTWYYLIINSVCSLSAASVRICDVTEHWSLTLYRSRNSEQKHY